MKTKSAYVCSECGYRSAKWLGKCPSCMQWNTMEEELIEQTPQKRLESVSDGVVHSQRIGELGMPDYMRVRTGVDELDRVLGGGFVTGSVVLAAGEPGIGKSTLLMQISASVGKKHKVLYVSGEESGWQLKYRAKRLGLDSSEFYILTETNMNRIMWELEKIAPDFLILDSIQTVYDEASSSTPGSTTQVRENTSKIINYAKNCGMTVIIVGHVNKEGGIAGPKVLEHMVDAVLYFEGERRESFRIIRAIKNRYGSTGEIGVFQMTDKGLEEVSNPSEMLLSSRPSGVSGNCPACVIEGTRPIIAEIQALSAKSFLQSPKRVSSGIEYNRLCLILAVLEKRLGLRFSSDDVYLNVIGGLSLDDPSCDLPVALALISSKNDRPLDEKLVAFGEIGLSGELRPVGDVERRIKEAARLGFTTVIIPKGNVLKDKIADVNVIGMSSIFEAIRIFKDNNSKEK